MNTLPYLEKFNLNTISYLFDFLNLSNTDRALFIQDKDYFFVSITLIALALMAILILVLYTKLFKKLDDPIYLASTLFVVVVLFLLLVVDLQNYRSTYNGVGINDLSNESKTNLGYLMSASEPKINSEQFSLCLQRFDRDVVTCYLDTQDNDDMLKINIKRALDEQDNVKEKLFELKQAKSK